MFNIKCYKSLFILFFKFGFLVWCLYEEEDGSLNDFIGKMMLYWYFYFILFFKIRWCCFLFDLINGGFIDLWLSWFILVN